MGNSVIEKKGISLSAFADEAGDSLAEQIEALKKNGIDKIELRFIDGKNANLFPTCKTKRTALALAEQGISVFSMGSPLGKSDIASDFSEEEKNLKRIVKNATLYGAKYIRIFSFYVDKKDKEKYRDEIIDRLRKMVDYAGKFGIILCHENEKGIYGEDIETCLDLYQNVQGLRAVFDPANFLQCGVDVKKAYEALSAYVEYLHIKDVKDGEIVPAGEGDGEIEYLLSSYKGETVTLEPHLSRFTGLSALEGKEKSEIGGRFASASEAFDYAVAALRKI